MTQDTTTVLISIAVTNADLQSAYELALAVGEDEASSSLLTVSPFTEDALIDFTTRLFEYVREAGLLDENAGGKARLIAGTVSMHGVSSKPKESGVQ